MRALIQRVSHASVTIDGQITGRIGEGLVVLVGIEDADSKDDVSWLVRKIGSLRIFSDGDGLMNKSINDIDGQILVVSQFTLHASTKKGNRPSFIKAARPEKAIPIYESFCHQLSEQLVNPIQTGRFGAMMDVELVNIGPVTILLDTKNKE